jgi:hypothetical protein
MSYHHRYYKIKDGMSKLQKVNNIVLQVQFAVRAIETKSVFSSIGIEEIREYIHSSKFTFS